MTLVHANDEELTRYISRKVATYSTAWMKSIYFDLFTNYQQLFNAHNALKSDYSKLAEENRCKQQQIVSLQKDFECASSSYKQQIFECQQLLQGQSKHEKQPNDHQNAENWNQNLLNSLQNKLNLLQKELVCTKSKYEQNSLISTKTIQILQSERQEQQQQIRRLQKENKTLQFELNSMKKESDFYQKNIASETTLQTLNYEQAQKNYQELKQTHCSNMKSMHCFLNQLSVRCNMFLEKYSNNTSSTTDVNMNGDAHHATNVDMNKQDDSMYFTKNIEPKLTLNQAKMEEFLNKIKMIMISQKTEHLRRPNALDLNLSISDFGDDAA